MKRKFNYKKIVGTIKDFILNNRLFLIYVFLSLLISFTLRIKTIGFPILVRPIFGDLLMVLLFGSIGYLIKPKYRYIYYLVWIIFASILALVNTVYYDFYQSYISINLIGTASMITQVNDSLFAKLHIHQFIYLLYIIGFMVVHKVFIKINYNDTVEDLLGKKYCKRILLTALAVLLSLAITMDRSDGSRFLKLWNREYIVKKYGLYVYTANDLIQSVRPKLNTLFGYDEAAYKFREYYSCRVPDKRANEFTNKYKDKNVIFIHAESIQNFLIDLKINGKEVTPNINRLAHEGIYFEKFYPQISVGTSSDTEFTLTTGLMPSSSGTVFVNYYDKTYYGMPNYFKNMGYYTFSAHANNKEYWNREEMHARLGYMDFFAKDYYDIPEDENSEDIVGLGLSDKTFFRQFVPILRNINERSNKYFGTIITLSNHSPFNDIEKYGEFDLTMDYTYEENGKKVKEKANYLEGSSMGNYLKSAHYADEALGELFTLLEGNNLLKDTIFILYGDHEARLAKSQFDLLYNYDPQTNSIKSSEEEDYFNVYDYHYDLLKNTPLIIWSYDEQYNKTISTTMGMYDVLPTIANMFGFKENYSLGHDIFNGEEGFVVFPNGNVLTDKIYYIDLNDEYISFTDEPISVEYLEALKEKSRMILDVSNGIVIHNLIERESDKIGECKNE